MRLLKPPWRILFIVAFSTLLGELAIMFVLGIFFYHPEEEYFIVWNILDPVILTAIILPVLYFFVLRPLNSQQQTLERQKKKLKIASVAFNSFNGVIVTNRQHVILKVNKAFTEITGYPESQVIGKTPAILQSGRHDKKFYKTMRESLERDRHWFGEIWNRRKNGEIYAEWLSITSVYDEDGQINYVGIFSDISQRKQAEESLEKFFEMTPELSCIATLKGEVIKINSRWVEKLGYSEEEIIKNSFLKYSHPDDISGIKKLMKNLKPGATTRGYVTRFLCKNGDTISVEWTSKVDDAGEFLYASAHDITERLRQEKELQEREQRLSLIFDTLSEGVALNEIVFNEKGEMVDYRILEVNKAFYDTADFLPDTPVIGSTATKIYKMDESLIKDFWIDHKKLNKTAFSEMVSPISQKYFEISTSPFVDNKFVTSFHDITEKKKAEKALRESESLLKDSQRIAKIGSYVFNVPEGVWKSSEVLDEIFGIDDHFPRTVEGWISLVHENQKDEMRNYLQNEVLGAGRDFDKQYRIQNLKDKEIRWVHGLGKLTFDENNRVISMHGIIQDITEKKKADERIRRLAHFDQLTGLPNRNQFNDRFRYVVSLAQRNQENFSLMFIDLDHFKNINETLGHSIGDKLLMEISKRLKEALRDGDILSRQGGDEFLVILPGVDAEGASIVAEKLIKIISEPCQIEGHDLTTTASLGIVIYPEDGSNIETLTRNSDTAMYRAKNSGRNNYYFFTAEMQEQAERNLKLINYLRHAIRRDELELYYQPQLDIHDGNITGAETLIRWHHPEFGLVPPGDFISIAEDSGQILEIGEWVLRTAVRQLALWVEEGLTPIRLAVNLSAVQFRQENLPEAVSKILEEANISPEYLELELTEAATMENPVAAIAMMQKLYDRGIQVAIDDFGTGYSNLNYLKKFKVNRLKIDQSFVRDITNPEEKAIVTAIINMASSLGLKTIAEGVETADQLNYLRLQGCHEVQGFYFSKPLPKDLFAQYMRNT